MPPGSRRLLPRVLLLMLAITALALFACQRVEENAASETAQTFLPLVSTSLLPPGTPAPPKYADVRIEEVIQDGPNNQILVLRNDGTAAQRMGGWSVWLQGTDEPIYEFSGGIIPAHEGKIWLTTSRAGRSTGFTLGYYPEDAGSRYIPGNVIILKDISGAEIDRYEVREIREWESAE